MFPHFACFPRLCAILFFINISKRAGGAAVVDAARRGGRRGRLQRPAVARDAGGRRVAPLRLPRQLLAEWTVCHFGGA